MLLARDRGGGHPATTRPCGVHREATPAGADFDRVVVRPQPQLVADAVQLAGRCGFQGVVVARIQRGGVHQVFGQEQPEEVVAQVVMRGDVAARAIAGIAAQCVPAAHRPPTDACGPALHRIQQVAVAYQQLHQADQVGAVPLAVHVRLRRAHAAVGGQRAIEAGPVHVDAQRCSGVFRITGADAAQRIGQHDRAAPQGPQLVQHAVAQEAVQRGEPGRGRGIGTCIHRGDSIRVGWSCTGTRFSQSRSACQWMPTTTCAVISG